MSKELEALECVDKILGYFGTAQIETMTLSKCNILTIKQALLKAQKPKCLDDEKLIKALNQIRKSHFTAMACLGIDKPDSETITAIEYVEQVLTTKSKKELAFDVIKENPYECATTINYIKINKDNHKMLDYEHYCMASKYTVSKEEFDLLKEVIE